MDILLHLQENIKIRNKNQNQRNTPERKYNVKYKNYDIKDELKIQDIKYTKEWKKLSKHEKISLIVKYFNDKPEKFIFINLIENNKHTEYQIDYSIEESKIIKISLKKSIVK